MPDSGHGAAGTGVNVGVPGAVSTPAWCQGPCPHQQLMERSLPGFHFPRCPVSAHFGQGADGLRPTSRQIDDECHPGPVPGRHVHGPPGQGFRIGEERRPPPPAQGRAESVEDFSRDACRVTRVASPSTPPRVQRLQPRASPGGRAIRRGRVPGGAGRVGVPLPDGAYGARVANFRRAPHTGPGVTGSRPLDEERPRRPAAAGIESVGLRSRTRPGSPPSLPTAQPTPPLAPPPTAPVTPTAAACDSTTVAGRQ